MNISSQPRVVLLIWTVLITACVIALFTGQWSVAFVSLASFALTIVPMAFSHRMKIKLPTSFLVAIASFVFATLFLGEVADFYERYWWWDVVLHGGSAIGFGLIGFLFVFFMFEGDRYAAPAIAISFLAFCFAMMIGATWEIFEFAMDQTFGMTMQKSGLVDTMWDLIVDMLGAFIGATAGFFYLKGRELGGLSGMIAQFVSLNRRFFSKVRNRR